jgi:hypothetical protein
MTMAVTLPKMKPIIRSFAARSSLSIRVGVARPDCVQTRDERASHSSRSRVFVAGSL